MKKYGLEVKNDWIIKGKFFPEYGYKGFKQIYKSGNLPEVIFCGNGMIAQGVYDGIRENGLKVPDDLCVVAIDHKKFAEMLYPKLTYIDYPTRTLGRKAMKLLLLKIENKRKRSKIENVILDTYLVENDSLCVSKGTM